MSLLRLGDGEDGIAMRVPAAIFFLVVGFCRGELDFPAYAG